MSFVFVVDQQHKPLDPIHPGRARYLLTTGHAAVLRRYPFTIILKDLKPGTQPQHLRVKLDPGSKTTGIAVVNDVTSQVIWAAEVEHRGLQVKERMDQRRACRFANRHRRDGWLPPSLESRIANVLTWVTHIQRWCPIGAISMELVKFDMQLMQNPEISGVEYQQGGLAGYELREYLLEKFHRQCAYCSKTATPLEVEHIIPKSRGGSDRLFNLTLACHDFNQAKGNRTAEEFGFPEVSQQARAPFKVHWLDAACVGARTPGLLTVQGTIPLAITAMGRHSRQMCRTNAYGFPDKAPKATSVVGGLRTGDIVRAAVPATSKKTGVYLGRIAIRATGSCNIKTARGTIQGIHFRYCQPLHRADGYTYTKGVASPPMA